MCLFPFLSFLLLFAVDERFLFLSTTTTTTMTTYDETSELSPSTTHRTSWKSHTKGVAVLVAVCLLFLSAGRLSTRSSSGGGGGASLEAAFLRGFQHDVVQKCYENCQCKRHKRGPRCKTDDDCYPFTGCYNCAQSGFCCEYPGTGSWC